MDEYAVPVSQSHLVKRFIFRQEHCLISKKGGQLARRSVGMLYTMKHAPHNATDGM